MRSTRRSRVLAWGLALACGGTCLQLTNCGIGSFVNGLNPCGTILACDPREYRFITSGYDGPGLDINADPFCTLPPYCTVQQDPLFGGLGGGGP